MNETERSSATFARCTFDDFDSDFYGQAAYSSISQLKLVDSKWTAAKDECHDLQRNSTKLSDVMGTAVCEAVMKKAPGTEHTVALLLIPRLGRGDELFAEPACPSSERTEESKVQGRKRRR